jgi:hypothetical protein
MTNFIHRIAAWWAYFFTGNLPFNFRVSLSPPECLAYLDRQFSGRSIWRHSQNLQAIPGSGSVVSDFTIQKSVIRTSNVFAIGQIHRRDDGTSSVIGYGSIRASTVLPIVVFNVIFLVLTLMLLLVPGGLCASLFTLFFVFLGVFDWIVCLAARDRLVQEIHFLAQPDTGNLS